jgi:hypothetical protein
MGVDAGAGELGDVFGALGGEVVVARGGDQGVDEAGPVGRSRAAAADQPGVQVVLPQGV